MALTNALLNPASTGRFRKKYTITKQDMVNLGAFTTGIITLDTLPIGTILMASRIKHTTAVGIATSLSARGSFNSVDLGAGALDVFAAVGTTDGTHLITDVTPRLGLTSATTPLLVKFTNGGANLSTVTAGSIDFFVDYIVLF